MGAINKLEENDKIPIKVKELGSSGGFHIHDQISFHFQISAGVSPARPGSPPRGLKNILDSAALTDEYRGFLAGLDSELETNTREEEKLLAHCCTQNELQIFSGAVQPFNSIVRQRCNVGFSKRHTMGSGYVLHEENLTPGDRSQAKK